MLKQPQVQNLMKETLLKLLSDLIPFMNSPNGVKKVKEADWALHLSKQTLYISFLKWSCIDLQQFHFLMPLVALHFGGRICFLAFEKIFLVFDIMVLMLLLSL